MFFCSYVFKKKHVLLFLCLQKNMFFCSYVFKKKHVLLFLCLQKKHVLLLREQQEHAFKAFTEVLYRLIRDFTEV